MAFGEILKQKRLELGWTREDVAARLNMRTCIVETLETENLKRIVAPTYGRGYIRNYCRELGIDPRPLEEDYLAMVEAHTFGATPAPVSHPDVHGLPERPVEPIHTGAHRTLPPTGGDHPPRRSGHTLVASAEASSSAVPQPQMPPVATSFSAPQDGSAEAAAAAPAAKKPLPKVVPVSALATSPQEEQPFVLQGDPLPSAAAPTKRTTPPPVPATPPAETPPPPKKEPARPSALGTFLNEKNKRPHREVSQPLPAATPAEPTQNIFGPQHPVPNPPNPQVGFILALFGSLFKGIAAIGPLVARLFVHRPKVRRMNDSQEPFFFKQIRIKLLVGCLLAVFATFVVFAFRYVFRMSADAETENGLSGTPVASGKPFEPRPIDTPPPLPYFK